MFDKSSDMFTAGGQYRSDVDGLTTISFAIIYIWWGLLNCYQNYITGAC